MPNPKRRHSNSRTGKRRSNDRIRVANLSVCTQCGKRKLPHIVCPACGYYAGVQAVTPRQKEKKKGS